MTDERQRELSRGDDSVKFLAELVRSHGVNSVIDAMISTASEEDRWTFAEKLLESLSPLSFPSSWVDVYSLEHGMATVEPGVTALGNIVLPRIGNPHPMPEDFYAEPEFLCGALHSVVLDGERSDVEIRLFYYWTDRVTCRTNLALLNDTQLFPMRIPQTAMIRVELTNVSDHQVQVNLGLVGKWVPGRQRV